MIPKIPQSLDLAYACDPPLKIFRGKFAWTDTFIIV